MKKRILFVSMATMGGCQRVTINYAKILQKKGYHCEFLLWINSKNDNNVVHELLPSTIHYSFLECKIRELPWQFYKFIRNKGGYDCVFSSWSPFNVSLCITKCFPFNKIKALIIRDDNMPSRHSGKIQSALKLFGRKANAFIAQTEEMKGEFSIYYNIRNNVVVINNPLDKDWIDRCIEKKVLDNQLAGAPIYIASGRISPQKDYITMIKAFNEVLKKKPLSHLYILGEASKDSVYAKQVSEEISFLHLENNVSFLGFQKNPYQFMNLADVFVLSSIYEGLPNVMIEAMYLGKAVAATNCIPYIDRVIENGKNGYKSAPKDYKSLANAMINAIELKNLPIKNDINKSEETIFNLFDSLIS